MWLSQAEENAPAPLGQLIVPTRQGALEGRAENGLRVWRGIPYAQAPVDGLRGRSPQPAQPWTEVRRAFHFGSEAVQQQSPRAARRGPLIGSEDCLYLNVWAPASDADSRRPVLVWIHGGGFVGGSGSDPSLDGTRFASCDDLIFVSINYRLGGFGFLLNDRDPASANLGLLDQIAALEWIRDNITGFGGDPGNVTVMGQSAGGMSISILLGTPRAEGLFQKAIVQSGGPTSVFAHGEPPQVTERALQEANLQQADQLLGLPTAELNEVFERLSANSNDPVLGGLPFHPGVDGIVLPSHPLDNLRPIPTLIGHAENEVAAFQAPEHAIFLEGLLTKKRSLVGDDTWRALEAVYRSTARPNRPWKDDLWSHAFTGVPSLRLADGLSAIGANVWSYRFDYPAAGPSGAIHGADVPFAFDAPNVAPLSSEWNNTAKVLANRMHESFVRFARTGDPDISALPAWPTHTRDGLAFMSFDAQSQVSVDFIGAARRVAWAPVLNADI